MHCYHLLSKFAFAAAGGGLTAYLLKENAIAVSFWCLQCYDLQVFSSNGAPIQHEIFRVCFLILVCNVTVFFLSDANDAIHCIFRFRSPGL
jgi:uncharacterized membrane protein YwzB